MEDPTDAPDLVTCMLWSDAGHYEKAVRGFRLLLDTAGPDLAVSYELAETIFVQGHYCESLEGLDHALAQENAANSTMRPALQMLGCLVRAHVTGQLRTAAQTADEILVACSPLGNIRVEDEVSVSRVTPESRVNGFSPPSTGPSGAQLRLPPR